MTTTKKDEILVREKEKLSVITKLSGDIDQETERSLRKILKKLDKELEELYES